MRLSDEVINEIRSRADIAQVVGHYLPLEKSGKDFKTRCPFHDDHDPSMRVSVDKQLYKCFVCGNGGNVFTFVQRYEHLGFVESVKAVADIIQYPLDIEPYEVVKTPKDLRKDTLYKVMDETIKFTMYQLNTANGANAKAYLNNRGMDASIIDMFQIGYNGSDDVLHRFLKAKGYEDEAMNSVNVVRLTANGIHDVFKDRITFPIHDVNGNPIGFSARTMNPEEPSKYINTTETELYSKGRTVYNLHRAKNYARKENRLLICEGVTDVIAFARAGIYHVCATLGTACTKEQIQLLKQTCNHLVFCYDGDRAGQNACYKAGRMAMDAGCHVSIIQNKTGLDPDEIIRQLGKDELVSMAGKEMSWVEFVFEYYLKQYDLSIYSEKKEFTQKMMAEIDSLEDDFDRVNFRHRLSQLTGFKISMLEENTPNVKPSTVRKDIVARPQRVKAQDGTTEAENLILNQMILSAEGCEIFKEELGFLIDDKKQMLAMMIIEEYRRYGSVDVARLLDQTQDDSLKALVLRIATSDVYPSTYVKASLMGALGKIKKVMMENRINQMKQQCASITNPQSKLILLKEIQQLQRDLRRAIDEES